MSKGFKTSRKYIHGVGEQFSAPVLGVQGMADGTVDGGLEENPAAW